MIEVYFYKTVALRDAGTKDSGTLIGVASTPEALNELINKAPVGSAIKCFSGERSLNMDQALMELGAHWSDTQEDWVY